MVFDVHCWSYFCVYSSLNDSLVENNELFSWINWIEGNEGLDLKQLSIDTQVQRIDREAGKQHIHTFTSIPIFVRDLRKAFGGILFQILHKCLI